MVCFTVCVHHCFLNQSCWPSLHNYRVPPKIFKLKEIVHSAMTNLRNNFSQRSDACIKKISHLYAAMMLSIPSALSNWYAQTSGEKLKKVQRRTGSKKNETSPSPLTLSPSTPQENAKGKCHVNNWPTTGKKWVRDL